MKVFFRRIHLYLSLAAGLVVMITCLTGAILVFEEELQHGLHHDRYFVAAGSDRLPLEQLAAAIPQKVPGAKVTGVKVYADPARTVEFTFQDAKGKDRGKDQRAAANAAATGHKSKAEQADNPAAGKQQAAGKETPPKRNNNTRKAFVNPYTGEVVEIYRYQDTFFYTVFALHRWLLGGDTGKMIVGVCTLLFLFILITGIVLWWPKTRRIMQQRITIKWNAGWKRVNHDLHIVLGFYTAIFLFVFAFTGLAWSFEWFNKGIYKVTGSSMERPKAPKSAPAAHTGKTSFDMALHTAQAAMPGARYYSISLPKGENEAISVSVLAKDAAHETATDMIYVDAFTGAKAGQLLFSEKNLGARVRSTFKPVHTGSIWGMPSKIIAFVVCLLGVSFPVTGTIMWINRLRKKKKGSGKMLRQNRRESVVA